MLGDQGLEAQGAGQIHAGHVLFVGQHHHVLDRGHVGPVFHEDGQEGQVGEDDLIFGVVDDVAELLGEQPGVEGVADRADPHDAVPGLHVATGVPGQSGDPVAGLDAHGQQGVGQTLGPLEDPGVAGADDRPLDRAADHFAVPVPGLRMLEDPVDRQRPPLHQTQHRKLLPPCRCGFGDKLVSPGRLRNAARRERRDQADPHSGPG